MNPSGNRRRSILSTLRRAMQFSVGGLLILQEKTEEFVEQAIERGQAFQEEGKQLVQEMRADRKKRRPERVDALDIRVNEAFKRLNVPTRKDIEELNQHIANLAQHIDEMKYDR